MSVMIRLLCALFAFFAIASATVEYDGHVPEYLRGVSALHPNPGLQQCFNIWYLNFVY
jgi:hypothetical protein